MMFRIRPKGRPLDRVRMQSVMFGICCLLVCAGLASAAGASNGTKLAVVTEPGAPNCSADGTSATVDITAGVTSSGSTAQASVLVSTDGGITFADVGTVATTDWSGSGRTKTAEERITVTIAPNGATPVIVCFVQPGANGNEFKRACSDLMTITAACSAPPPECYPPPCTI